MPDSLAAPRARDDGASTDAAGEPGQTTVMYGGATVRNLGNADCQWDEFDSDSYFEHNYAKVLPDDERVANIIASFFADNFRPRPGALAIDVGAGANLYPALAMLPFADTIVLCERARSNRDWLTAQIERPAPSWQDFWDLIRRGRRPYDAIEAFPLALSRRARVLPGDVFQLPKQEYRLGTMFFVAESITTKRTEFRRATRSFVESLHRYAPFAAAFMKNSSGYQVGGREYPACTVDESDIRRCFAGLAHGVKLKTIEETDVRSGYKGMIVVTGFAGKK